jgi:hypothetical protein
MAKRALWAAPVALVVGGAVWGVDGAISVAYALAIVLLNFALAAISTSYAARISDALLMGAAMFGFFIRLAVLFGAFWVAKDASWMKVVPFGITVVVAHLGLLLWEMRYVSATLAFPGLKPGNPPASPKES